MALPWRLAENKSIHGNAYIVQKTAYHQFISNGVLLSRVTAGTYRGSSPEVARKDSQTYVDVDNDGQCMLLGCHCIYELGIPI